MASEDPVAAEAAKTEEWAAALSGEAGAEAAAPAPAPAPAPLQEQPSANYDDDFEGASPVTSPNATLTRSAIEPDSPAAGAAPDSPTGEDFEPETPAGGAAPESLAAAAAPGPAPAPAAAAEPAAAAPAAAQPAAAEPAAAEPAAAEPAAAEPAAAKPAVAAEPAAEADEVHVEAAAPAQPAAAAAEPVPEAAAAAEPAPASVPPSEPASPAAAAAAEQRPAEMEVEEDPAMDSAQQGDSLDDALNASQGDIPPSSPAPGSEKSLSRTSPKSKSMSALGSYADLKKKTSFANVATEGVKKDGTYMIHFSNFKTGPKFSMGTRTGGAFAKSSQGPAPGSYNLVNEDKSKYTAQPRFSFGGCARWGLGASPTKKAPGPGAYNPKDPTLNMEVKVGFGSSCRSKGPVTAQPNPGPGAYEARPTLGSGLMFTAGGRHPTNINRSRSQPGPGAYTPNPGPTYNTPPKCGFGTSTRTDFAARNRNASMPGPGTYEMQNFRSTGSDAPKYSATSRRRVHDLNSYVTPGPGSYNSHVTSFGY